MENAHCVQVEDDTGCPTLDDVVVHNQVTNSQWTYSTTVNADLTHNAQKVGKYAVGTEAARSCKPGYVSSITKEDHVTALCEDDLRWSPIGRCIGTGFVIVFYSEHS